MKNTLCAGLILAAGLMAVFTFGRTYAQSPSPNNEAPQLVFQNLADGAVVNEPLFVVQICFANPINIRDRHLGGDFAFSVTAPGGRGLGLRIVFQPDGYGAAIYPGPSPGETTGEWAFGWRVTSPNGEQVSEGEILYAVDPDGEESPTVTLPACVGEQGTATPSGEETSSPLATSDGTPGATTSSPSPSSDASATDRPENPDDDDDGDLLIVLIVIIGVASIGGAAAIAFFGWRASRRRPRSAGGESSDEG